MEMEKELITSKELAKMLSFSVKFIEKHRNRIIGAQKVAGRWRYNIRIIRQRLATGKDIIIK
ncbi:MAG: hypothetical protein GXY77_02535 [Fibrobacter sp.]|nr:hypothetical protein [Fibrobacter sp.]